MDNLCSFDTTTPDTTNSTPTMKDETKSIVDYLIYHAEQSPDRIYMTQPMGGDGDNIRTWTYQQTVEESKRIASYITSLGLEPGSNIALCSKNCGWWMMADFAILMAGHVTVPIYPTLNADTVAYTLEHSEAKFLFVGKLDAAPWAEMSKGVPEGTTTISFPLCPEGTFSETWADLLDKNEPIESIVPRVPEELATIIYTSGSTGKPKGVMISSKTMTVAALALGPVLDIKPDERMLSYLPLAHTMERWCVECVSCIYGLQIFFADKLATFKDDLVRCKPTLFLSVPRLYTKFQQGVFKKFPPKKLNLLFSIPIVGSIVKKKILKTLGLDSVKFAGSGSAPIPAELISWYNRVGLELLEGYGMTENFSYSHLSKPGHGRAGYVGTPYEDCDHRLTDNGEIEVLSPGIMMGYYKNPEATAEVMTEDGWLKTGDKGEIDEKNRLKITGRTKELFKTSKGKYVAPAPIECKLIVNPRIELACVSGVAQPFCHAIIQISEDARKDAATDAGKEAIENEFTKLLTDINATLDEHEHVGFVVVAKDEWLPENGFLTPTQKIKRAAIEAKYSSNEDTWYDSKKKVIWHEW